MWKCVQCAMLVDLWPGSGSGWGDIFLCLFFGAIIALWVFQHSLWVLLWCVYSHCCSHCVWSFLALHHFMSFFLYISIFTIFIISYRSIIFCYLSLPWFTSRWTPPFFLNLCCCKKSFCGVLVYMDSFFLQMAFLEYNKPIESLGQSLCTF